MGSVTGWGSIFDPLVLHSKSQKMEKFVLLCVPGLSSDKKKVHVALSVLP